MVTASARREWVRFMVEKGMSERRALVCASMSASAYRYVKRERDEADLVELILDLSGRHPRYGAPMLHMKLRQMGHIVNHKRVERIYREHKLKVRKRKRKAGILRERRLLEVPASANHTWSWDFVFDRSANGRVLKCLTLVDDCTKEAITIEVEHSITGNHLVEILNRLAKERPLPKTIRSDNVLNASTFSRQCPRNILP